MCENNSQESEALAQKSSPDIVPTSNTVSSVYEVPVETAPEKVRLDSPGYLLLHPELTGKAIRKTIFSSAIQIIAFMAVFGYILAEVRSFLYLLSHYGFIR